MTPPPFVRSTWHRFADFVAFEDQLREDRRRDPSYRQRLDALAEPWMKVRLQEVLGVWNLARALSWPDDSEYRIAEAYADVDIEIRNDPDLHRLQVTTAGPIWPDGSPHWGVDHKLQMEQLRRSGHCSGWGPFRRLPGGQIVNNKSAISRDELDDAFGTGLTRALERKASHQSPDLGLLICAFGYEIWDAEIFADLAQRSLRAVPTLSFAAVHFVTNQADVYFCSV